MDGGARVQQRVFSVKAIYNGSFIGMKRRAKTSSRIMQFKGNGFLFFVPFFLFAFYSSLSFFFLFFIWKGLIEAFANHVPVALVNSFVVDVIDGNA